MRGRGLAVRVNRLRVVCRGCRRARRIGTGLSAAERFLPESKETFGEVLGEITFRSGCEFLRSLVKVFTEGPEDLKFDVVSSDLLVDKLVGCFRNVDR